MKHIQSPAQAKQAGSVALNAAKSNRIRAVFIALPKVSRLSELQAPSKPSLQASEAKPGTLAISAKVSVRTLPVMWL